MLFNVSYAIIINNGSIQASMVKYLSKYSSTQLDYLM